MFTKSFVSIYFLPDRVYLLTLSSNKKKVKKHGQVVLPEGLIKDNRIQDINALSKVLSSAKAKLGIREKVAGLIIPEFSTFTKYFKLPSLSVSEIDEAVRWQAQEYLPGGLENTILDWKVSKKDSSGVEVMTVSVDKDVLTEYLDTAEKAGFYPMKVETPSICLLRFSEKEEGGVMAIYKNFNETILVVSEGKKIVGTSLQHTDNFDEILKSASKMLNHYDDIKVEIILVGGEGIEQNLEKIASALRRKVQIIDPGVGGLESSEIQKNLIAISMQFEDAQQPADPTTINLLPSVLVDNYKSQKLKNQVWTITLTITLFVWISFFVTLVSYLFMTQNIKSLKDAKNSGENTLKVTNPLEEIESINTISRNILKIKNETFAPQTVLNGIYTSKPPGVKIIKYALDLDKGLISLQGQATDRLTLINFKESLEKLDDFENVEIPISSFEAETNLEFSLTFSYLPIKSTVKDKPVKVNLDSIQ